MLVTNLLLGGVTGVVLTGVYAALPDRNFAEYRRNLLMARVSLGSGMLCFVLAALLVGLDVA